MSLRTFILKIVTGLIKGYTYTFACFACCRCRFLPTCSAYALEVFDQHGLIKGGWMILKRLGRCHPLSRGGLDLPPH